MTNRDAWTLYDKYLAGWRAVGPEERARLAAAVIADDAHYATRNHASGGRDTMIADMAAFQQRFPGGHFEIGDVSSHHDVALLTWVLVKPDGVELARGHDMIRVRDGKIIDVVTFPPSAQDAGS
jgi:ketosteroid isomerase-like protein